MLFAAPPALAKAVLLEPSGKWQMIYDEDGCRLGRSFGEGKNLVILFLDRYQPASELIVSVVGKPFARRDVAHQPIAVDFGPGLPASAAKESLVGVVGPDQTPMLMLGFRDLLNRPVIVHQTAVITPRQESAISQLTVRSRGQSDVTLRTGEMGAPMAAMRACTTDLVQHWKLDPVQQEHRMAGPTPIHKPGEWLRSGDYPTGALRMGVSAVIDFRLMVDAAGQTTECHIQRMTNNPEFATLTCKLLMKRAKFRPALDSEGKPIASYYVSSVRWINGN